MEKYLKLFEKGWGATALISTVRQLGPKIDKYDTVSLSIWILLTVGLCLSCTFQFLKCLLEKKPENKTKKQTKQKKKEKNLYLTKWDIA